MTMRAEITQIGYDAGFIEGIIAAKQENYRREQEAFQRGYMKAMEDLLPFMTRMESTRQVVISLTDIDLALNPAIEKALIGVVK